MEKKINSKKAQSFSTDIVVVIVILLFGVLFLVINKIDSVKNDEIVQQTYDKASEESTLVVENMKKTTIIDSENNVNVDLLLQMNHDKIKEELGITGDFAIAFEKDGKLVKIDSENDITCIGSSNIIVNGKSCN